MSRHFSFNKGQIACNQHRCLSREFLDLGGVELPPDMSFQDRLNRLDDLTENERLKKVAWDALGKASLPKGWMHLTGGKHYDDREWGSDPDFCSLRCARLWISANERIGTKKGDT